MFYEMLTGRVAFPAPTEYARLAAVLGSEPEPIDRVDPALAPVGPFISRVLMKNRDDRFPTALEMARALVVAVPHAASSDVQGNALSRLPEVSPVFSPQPVAGVPSTASMRDVPAAQPQGPATAADGGQRGGGTLASAAGRAVADPAPQVLVVPPAASVGGTLPSRDLPVLGGPGARGVPAWIVALLVVAALGAGFMLGWAAAHMS
jgi:hypothetical protein